MSAGRLPDPRARDAELGAALQRYARAVTSQRVSVTCRDGVAHVSGHVPSETVRTALIDMLRAHEGVRNVVSNLVAGAEGATRPVRRR